MLDLWPRVDHPVDCTARCVANDPAAAPLSIPQTSIGIDGRAVCQSWLITEIGEDLRIVRHTKIGVIGVDQYLFARHIGGVHLRPVRAEADAVGDVDCVDDPVNLLVGVQPVHRGNGCLLAASSMPPQINRPER